MPRDCHQTQSRHTDGAVAIVPRVRPATRDGIGHAPSGGGPMSSTTTSTVAGVEIGHPPEVLGHPLPARAAPTAGTLTPQSTAEVQLDRDDAVLFVDLDAVVPRTRVPSTSPCTPVDLERRVGRVAREHVRRDERVPFHQADCCSRGAGAGRSTSSVTSGRAKNRNGTNVVPVPGETCITPPAARVEPRDEPRAAGARA